MYNVLTLAMICTFMELSSRHAKDTLVLNDIFAATILLRRALACQCHVRLLQEKNARDRVQP